MIAWYFEKLNFKSITESFVSKCIAFMKLHHIFDETLGH